jgi:hypothetical protein
MDYVQENAGKRTYMSHRLSPTCLLRMKSKKKSQNEKPPNQDFAQEGHDPQFSGVAQEWDQGSFPDAGDGGTGCHQECGHFNDYKKAQKAYVEAKKAVELVRAGLALLNKISGGSRMN